MAAEERNPTPDEFAGIAWWNALTEAERAKWLAQAGTAVPADAWAEYKRQSTTIYLVKPEQQ